MVSLKTPPCPVRTMSPLGLPGEALGVRVMSKRHIRSADSLGPNTCPPPPDMAEYTKTDRSFVYDYSEYMDFCRHPELVTSVSRPSKSEHRGRSF